VLAADGEEFIEKLGRGNKVMTYHQDEQMKNKENLK